MFPRIKLLTPTQKENIALGLRLLEIDMLRRLDENENGFTIQEIGYIIMMYQQIEKTQ